VKKLVVLAALAALTLWGTQPAFSQSSEELKGLRKELESLKEGQTAIQKELQEIKNFLRARPVAAPAEPQNIVLSVADAPFKGERTAKLTLIDFSDYQ
jgi:hypothetical protein